MDPASLAAAVTGLLAPFLEKAAGSILDEIGKKLPETAGKLWDAVLNRFKGKPAAVAAASDLAKNAKDTDNQEAFALQLRKLLKEDPEFSGLVEGLLKQAAGTTVNNTGEGAAAAGGSIAVGKIQAGRDISGNIAIGNNSQAGDPSRKRKK